MEKRMRGQGVGSGKQGGGAAGMVHSKQTKLRGERESRKDSGKEPSANKRVRFGTERGPACLAGSALTTQEGGQACKEEAGPSHSRLPPQVSHQDWPCLAGAAGQQRGVLVEPQVVDCGRGLQRANHASRAK